MAGFLDTLLGTPDQTQALGLLGGALASGQGFGRGALLAQQHLAQAPQRQLQTQLAQAQLQETLAQAEERRQKAEMAKQMMQRQNELLYGSSGGIPSLGAASGAAPQGAMGLVAQARAMGIPEEAIKADIAFNGGKGISEMLFKRGAPDMTVANGYVFDKNRMGAGFLPQMNVSNDGKATMVRIGPDGLPVVEAPTGALNTYAGYQNVQEGTKANYDPITVTPAGQPPQMTTRGDLVRNPQMRPRVLPAEQAARDGERTFILQAELAKANQQLQDSLRRGDQSGAARAQADIAALTREMGGRTATVGMPLQSEADKLREAKGVEGDAKTNEARSKDIATAKKFLGIAQQAEGLLKSGPTASGIGSAVDKGAALFGMSTKGAVAAQQLKAIGGWLVANVPRMEGPQSNFDVDNYKIMAANVANDSLPVDQRLAALNTIKTMMENTINGGPSGSWEPTGKASSFSSGGWSATRRN